MNTYKTLVKELLAEYASGLRKSKGYTQEEISEQLRISSRSYSDLETGKHCFSAPSLLFFLTILSEEERKELLSKFQSSVNTLED